MPLLFKYAMYVWETVQIFQTCNVYMLGKWGNTSKNDQINKQLLCELLSRLLQHSSELCWLGLTLTNWGTFPPSPFKGKTVPNLHCLEIFHVGFCLDRHLHKILKSIFEIRILQSRTKLPFHCIILAELISYAFQCHIGIVFGKFQCHIVPIEL